MSYSINAKNSRLISRYYLTIFNDNQSIIKQVITDAGYVLYDHNVNAKIWG